MPTPNIYSALIRSVFSEQPTLLSSMATNLVDMLSYLSLSKAARIIVTALCLICFVLQSHKEIEKFLTNMTSVSTQLKSGKDENIRLPRFAVCADEPFKSDKFPENLDEYLNLTYSKNELLGAMSYDKIDDVANDLDQFKVTEVATIYYGRCYIVEIDDPVVFVGLKIEATLYFIDQGQELCVINSILGCDVQIESVDLHKFHYDIRIEANKIVKEER